MITIIILIIIKIQSINWGVSKNTDSQINKSNRIKNWVRKVYKNVNKKTWVTAEVDKIKKINEISNIK